MHISVQVAETIVDRVADIARFFPTAVDVGCGRGHIAKAISGDLVASLYQCDMAERALVTGCLATLYPLYNAACVYNYVCRGLEGLPPMMSSRIGSWLTRRRGCHLLTRPLTLLSAA